MFSTFFSICPPAHLFSTGEDFSHCCTCFLPNELYSYTRFSTLLGVFTDQRCFCAFEPDCHCLTSFLHIWNVFRMRTFFTGAPCVLCGFGHLYVFSAFYTFFPFWKFSLFFTPINDFLCIGMSVFYVSSVHLHYFSVDSHVFLCFRTCYTYFLHMHTFSCVYATAPRVFICACADWSMRFLPILHSCFLHVDNIVYDH